MRILLIDDDRPFSRVLSRHLESDGHEVTVAYDGREGLRLAFACQPDLILLDLRLDASGYGMSGHTVCTRVREMSRVPIMYLSAVAAEADVVRALRAGADGYLVKPFSMAELRARVRAILRRTMGALPESSARYADETLQIDLAARQLTKRGKASTLSPIEIRLLQLLLERRGHVVSREELVRAAWGENCPGLEQYYRRLTLYVGYLRRKIEDNPRQPRYLLTTYGKGYTFAGPYDTRP